MRGIWLGLAVVELALNMSLTFQLLLSLNTHKGRTQLKLCPAWDVYHGEGNRLLVRVAVINALIDAGDNILVQIIQVPHVTRTVFGF